MADKERILVTIAARGGSKGVKDKNIRELCGVPLIAHTILQAKRWGKADMMVCSTDSERIASVARDYGAEAPFLRPAELATDTAGKLEVLRHTVGFMEKLSGRKFTIVVDLDATAPVRKAGDIEGALRLFLEHRPKSVFSVVPCHKNPYFNMVEVGTDGLARLVKEPAGAIKRRQDAPEVYDMNASIYVYDRDYVMDQGTKSAISDRSMAYVMDGISAFDIDKETDFQFIEFLVSKGLVRL